MKYIVKAKKTYLKSPLSAAASSIVLRELIDSKGNDIELADFGDWFTVVVKQGDTIEIIKCDGITQNADNATLDVATDGRNIDPTTPFAGYATGETFQSGAEVIVTNDPLAMAQFGNLNLANTWLLLQTFSVAPRSSADAVASDELVRLSQLQAAVLGTLSSSPLVVPANAGETVTEDKLVYLKAADGEWYLADADVVASVENVVLGMTRGAGTDGNAISGGVTLIGEHEFSGGLTANVPYYASNTAGGISTSAGTKEVIIGFSKSTTKLMFMPRFSQQLTEDIQDALEAATGALSSANAAMSQKGFQAGAEIYGADSVGTDAYAIAPTPAVTAYTAGMEFQIKIGTANTGACTLAVGSGAAKAIKKKYNEDLVTGDLLAGQLIKVAYDAANDCWQMLSPTITGNIVSQISDPSRSLGTDYQNTTGKNLLVMVTVQVSRGTSAAANNFGRATAYMDTASSPTTVVGWVEQLQVQTGANNEDYQAPTMMLTFVVPNGSYYRVSSSGTGSSSGATLKEWSEQTL